MLRAVKFSVVVPLLIFVQLSSAWGGERNCERWFVSARARSTIEWLKKTAIDKVLDVMAYSRGLPKYRTYIQASRESGSYRDDYDNFGEMGLAELGVAVRYNAAALARLNTGRPLIIVANHHLGIADGLALQYLVAKARPKYPALLFLARWIEKLLPHAVFGDEHGWGTALPVDINTPKRSDPNYEAKVAEVKAFNSSWTRTSARALRRGAALIVFPAGHVASVVDGESYPAGARDADDSWQTGFVDLARLGKADIVFANVDSVNSEAFYRDRKRFGGGDKERVIWFFSEAIAKRGQVVDVHFSEPKGLDEIYDEFTRTYGHSREILTKDRSLLAELMRRTTYKLAATEAPDLDTTIAPEKTARAPWVERRHTVYPLEDASPTITTKLVDPFAPEAFQNGVGLGDQ